MSTLRSAGAVGILAVAVGLLAACGPKTPLSDTHKAFAGRWVAADGTWVHIFLDGSGSVKTANTEVNGGQATIAGATLTIGLFGIEKKFAITQPPTEVEGRWILVLDNIEYVRESP
ncbi:MAG TPA: hypothetical protein PLK89_15960 [Acidobacteriota bacterium]|nr:hypothetical protein [Acidobacteriota bacterium]HQO27208.1 hypothetical protein [Acidobacteriota bacterium]